MAISATEGQAFSWPGAFFRDYGSLPSCQSFLEVKVDDVFDAVAFSGEHGVRFLCGVSGMAFWVV